MSGPQNESRARSIRNGDDISQEDMAGLQAAMSTPEGLATYNRLTKLASRESNGTKKDALMWQSLNFWKGGFFRPGENAFASATQSHRRKTGTDSVMVDGDSLNVTDMYPDADHATANYQTRADLVNLVRTGRVRSTKGTQETRGFMAQQRGNSDPAVNAERGDIVRSIVDAITKQNLLQDFFLLMQHWKFDVPSYIGLTRQEVKVYQAVEDAKEESILAGKGDNVRDVAKRLGNNFVLQRVAKKIGTAIVRETRMSREEVIELLSRSPNKPRTNDASGYSASRKSKESRHGPVQTISLEAVPQ